MTNPTKLMTRCPTCGGKVANLFEHVDLKYCASIDDAPHDGRKILGLYSGDIRIPVRFEWDRSHPAGGPSLGPGWVDAENMPANEPEAWTHMEAENG